MAERKNAPKLNDRIRDGIIVRFACCYSPEEVKAWLKEEHGLELTDPALSYYNANNPAARSSLSEKWRARFDVVREEYVSRVDAPIAFKAHRLRLANTAAERILARLGGDRSVNVVMVETLQRLLEYAAKEDGGMFTNRRILEHDAVGALAQLIGCDPAELPEEDA